MTQDGENDERPEPRRRDAAKTYDDVREQLRYWPYAVHQIDDTLDIDLIEGRGRQLLFQAINSRILTAFAGSGVSAAYGRLGWWSWQQEQFSVVEQGTKAFDELATASVDMMDHLIDIVRPDGSQPAANSFRAWAHNPPDSEEDEIRQAVEEQAVIQGAIGGKPDDKLRIKERERREELRRRHRYNIWRWLDARRNRVLGAQKQIVHLKRTFERANAEGGHFPGGEELPIKFQIAQQLHEELRRHVGIFLEPRVGEDAAPDEDQKERMINEAWAGSRIDREGAAPVEALEWLQGCLPKHFYPRKWRRDYREALGVYFDLYARPQARASAEDYAKMLLVDERAHAMITLRGGLFPGIEVKDLKHEQVAKLSRLEAALDIYDLGALRRDIPGIREAPDRFRVLRAFEFQTLERISAELEKQMGKTPGDAGAAESDGASPDFKDWHFAGSIKAINSALKRYADGRAASGSVRRTYLTPSSRFLVGAYLALHPDPWSLVWKNEGKEGLADDSDLFPKPDLNRFRGRRSVIAQRFDPLSKIVRGLGVRRFITLNYDFEIERYFQDAGYRNFPKRGASVHTSRPETPHPDASRVDGLGGVLTDRTFERETAADLVEFAVGAADDDAGVFHLHGRATREDGLVITERDYMNLYLWEDEHRDTVNEGIAMAFSSTPLLFLGLGMEEADLLRPLRQFMSNRDRTVGYRAVALLPADKTIEARTKFSVSTFLRYGVHTIFYGSGAVKLPDTENGGEKSLGLDWLCRMMVLRAALKNEFKALRKEIENCKDGKKCGGSKEYDDYENCKACKKRNVCKNCEVCRVCKPKAVLARLARAVGQVTDDIAGYEEKTSALGVLLGERIVLPEKGAANDDLLEKEFESIAKALVAERSKKDLLVCSFTPIRPELIDGESRHYDDNLLLNGKDYVGFATKVMSEMLRLVLRMHLQPDKVHEREFAAAQIMLDGLGGSLLTGSLNAQLVLLEREWRSWWYNWQQSPPHRIARFQSLAVAPEALEDDPERHVRFEPARVVRHRVDSLITNVSRLEEQYYDGRHPELIDPKGRLVENGRTKIRAFDTFIEALADLGRDGTPAPDPERRFLTTIAAARGYGKGTLLTAMATRKGLSLYEAAVWRRDGDATASSWWRRERENPSFIVAAIFINLNFSTEIASTFDMLIDTLRTVTAALAAAGHALDTRKRTRRSIAEIKIDLSHSFDPGREDNKAPYRVIRKSRVNEHRPAKDAEKSHYKEFDEQQEEIRRLSRLDTVVYLFGRFKSLSEKLARHDGFGRPRLLLYLSGMDLTFRRDGRPKNGEIAALYTLLLGETAQAMPIDIVLVGSEYRLGYPFNTQLSTTRGDARPARDFVQVQMDRRDLPGVARERIRDRRQSGSLVIDPKDTPLPAASHGSGDRVTDVARINHVHFARPVSATALLLDNFQVLAIALYINRPPEYRGPQDPKQDKHWKKAQDAYRHGPKEEQNPEGETEKDPWLSDEPISFAEIEEKGRELFKNAMREGLQKADEKLDALWCKDQVPSADVIHKARKHLSENVSDRLAPHIHACAILCGDLNVTESDTACLDAAVSKALEAYQQREISGGQNRWGVFRRQLAYNRFSQTLVLAAAENIEIHAPDLDRPGCEADTFIGFIVDQVRNVGEERRASLILQLVIDRYKRFAMIGDPDLDIELHELLLRHLAVIGAPVSAAVLVRVPEVRDYFERVWIETETSRRRFIARALTTMAYRGFVFRLDPHPRLLSLAKKTERMDAEGEEHSAIRPEMDQFWPAENEYRYALHRTVRLHAIGKLGVGRIDPVQQNSFAPRLYAAMESTGIGITSESYSFLRTLLVGLSQYPDVPNDDVRLRPWLFTTRYRNIRVQALRAALSLVRTTLSVATISRLRPDPSLRDAFPKLGLMEVYKVRLRWLIRMSWEIVNADEVKDAGDDPRAELSHLNALYRDEIVWLYNEIGTVCLAQGALVEALGFLRQAAEFNEGIEGTAGSGPLARHVSLNHALVQFERGRLQSASTRFKAIVASDRAGDVPTVIAKGYLCVLSHLTGHIDGLGPRFDAINAALEELGEPRACAIFLTHSARYYAACGEEEAALAQLVRARGFAETGGHEDIRHRIDIAELSVTHRHRAKGGRVSDGPDALRRLEGVEAFGRRMGLWNLQVDALTLRARILFDTGETSTAGALVVRAMAIAKRNGMILRLNVALSVYAAILRARGDTRGAARHAGLSLRMAKRIGYATEAAKAREILTSLERQT